MSNFTVLVVDAIKENCPDIIDNVELTLVEERQVPGYVVYRPDSVANEWVTFMKSGVVHQFGDDSGTTDFDVTEDWHREAIKWILDVAKTDKQP